jgi:hypothetical protein
MAASASAALGCILIASPVLAHVEDRAGRPRTDLLNLPVRLMAVAVTQTHRYYRDRCVGVVDGGEHQADGPSGDRRTTGVIILTTTGEGAELGFRPE